MRALTVIPSQKGSLQVTDVPEPEPGPGDLLVDGMAVGVCGTDREIAEGLYGSAPPGQRRLVIGHESLGRVRAAPDGSGFQAGDLVVGVVRRPDPEPCLACAHGEFDMCRNDGYTERGIKGIDGYASQRWVVDPDYAVRLAPELAEVGMLMEPTTIVAKAWDQIEKVGARSAFEPRSVLVTGAGSIGLLAALLGVQRGLDVHVLGRAGGGPKPALLADLGATYHCDGLEEVARRVRPDIVIEATAAEEIIVGVMTITSPYGIVCLLGVSTPGSTIPADMGAVNRKIVLENDVVIGSVNANLRHYRLAADALARADVAWLSRLVSRRVPLEDFAEAFAYRPGDVKVVIELDGTG
ncbi:glucose 1-dehydrogenase [Marinactinospora endophytica]